MAILDLSICADFRFIFHGFRCCFRGDLIDYMVFIPLIPVDFHEFPWHPLSIE